MKRSSRTLRAPTPLALERLEDRDLPGDALGALLTSLLTAFFADWQHTSGLFDLADAAAGNADAKPLTADAAGRPSPLVLPPWLTAPTPPQRTESTQAADDTHDHAPPVAPEAGSLFSLLSSLNARMQAAVSPPADSGTTAAPAAAAGSPASAQPAGDAAGDHNHDDHDHDHHDPAPVPIATPSVNPEVQSAGEVAQIAHFTAEYARYEAEHPHGHDVIDGDHDHKEPPAVPLAPGGDITPASPVFGQWGPTLNWPLVTVHSHMLSTGKVMLWAYSQNPRRFWDPNTGQIDATLPADPGYNIFCVGHSFLADGRLFVAGGHVQNGWGLPNASIYDPVSNTWTRVPDMNAGRWYPTSTTLPNGDVLVTSGSMDINFTNNTLPQVYQVATNTWRDLTSARLNLPLYPFMFVAPNGRVFDAGPQQMSRYLDTASTGAWTNVANNTFGYRDYGTAVMYEPGKVLLVGGGGGSDTGPPPSATAEVIDLNAATPTWRSVAPMSIGRRQLNATLLPDGKVLVTGGSSAAGFNNQAGAVYTAEIWDPATETWTTLASSTQYRGYHSTALLLPDGRVLSSGGDNHPNAEVFSPPYLFKSARPTVTAAPTAVGYGQAFSIQTPDAANVSKVTLLRVSSVTHAIDMNQRFNSLSFTSVAGGLNVTAPANANLAPPGDYMMYLINADGVPSVANIVRIGAAGVPEVPGSLTAAAASPTQVNVAWQDTSTTETGFQVERRTGGGAYAVIATLGANATTYQDTGRTPGTQYTYRVRATNANGASAYSNEATATTPVPVLVIDDRDAGFSTTGTWDTYAGLGHLNDFTYSATGTGADVASWAFTVTPGLYRVSATWVARPNRATNAPYAVFDGASQAALFRADQRQDPNDFTEAGSAWENLGTVPISGTALTVRLSDAANTDYVIADGVRVEYVGALPQGPEIQVQDGSTDVPDGTGSVGFGSTVVGSSVSKTFTVRNLGTSNLTLGSTITVPAGFTVTSGFGNTTLVPGASTTFTVRLDAAAVGTYAGPVSFTNNDADETPFDFAVSGGVTVPATVQVVDDRDAGYTTAGNWDSYAGLGNGGDFSYSPTGSGADVATWTFSVPAGQYQVATTWVERPNRATNAPYTVLDGGTVRATVAVNQQLAPNDFSAGGTVWEALATVTVSGGSLVVRLTDAANSAYVIADAVRVERVG